MNTFYDLEDMTIDETKQFMIDAHDVSYRWWFDELDCSESWCRQLVKDISFEETLTYIDERCHPCCIYRQQPHADRMDLDNIEIGFRSMRSPDYFLWIMIDPAKARDLIKGLKKIGE